MKRWLKVRVYLRLPLFVRPFLYWCFRYVLLLGFLDGRAGLVFHFLHAFWYQFLIDAKLVEAAGLAADGGAPRLHALPPLGAGGEQGEVGAQDLGVGDDLSA